MNRISFRVISLGAMVLFVLAAAVPADALEFGARAYYWYPSLSATQRVDSGGATGTEINLKDDLDISNKGIPSVEAFAGVGKHHVSLMYSQVDYSGSRTLGRALTFNGKTFAQNAQVDSDFKVKMLDADYQFDLLNLENILAGFSVGVIGKIKYFNGETRMNSSTAGSVYDEKKTYDLVIPMVGAGAHLGILANILEARAKVTGMSYSSTTCWDALADISVTPFPFLDIHGGYRYMKLKSDNVSDFYADMEFSGPFVALTVSW